MSLTSYRAAPPRAGYPRVLLRSFREIFEFLFRFGGDLLSHVLRRSTIGATALNCRVREGIGCFARAMATKPKKRHGWVLFSQPNISVVPSLGCCCHGFSVQVRNYAFDVLLLMTVQELWLTLLCQTLLLLDQIKPIEQLVPVS